MSHHESTLVVAGLVYFEVAAPVETLDVEPGRERFDERLRIGLGGALNTASVVHALGRPVVLAYPSGHGLSDRAAALVIRELGLPSLTWDARDDTALSLVIEHPSDRAFVSRADYEALARCPSIPPASHVHVPGLVEARLLGARLEEARRAGAAISVSGSWAPAELESLVDRAPGWDLLLLNEDEATLAAGSAKRAPDVLRGAATNVVVTRGAAGAIGRVDGAWLDVPARPTAIHDATGAGDAFAAGFLVARMSDATGEEAAAFATEVAARQLKAPGGVAVEASGFADLEETP